MALVVRHSLKRRLGSCVAHPFSTHSNVDTTTTTTTTPPIQIYNALDQGCMEYSKSWAWQHVLLSRRLEHRRRRRRHRTTTTMTTNDDDNDDDTSEEDDDQDCILFLEHSPVYTLGRGSDESHLTFLNSTNNNNNNDETIRHQLSRKARGPGTARLAVDRGQQQQQQDTTNTSIQTEISTLCQIATPVISPNGVPIYRVERGGEVTFHGPQQLVVYPLIDLKREPYRQDLHWYLRMVEEVIIQTLAHYNIKGERDEDNNTGVWVNNEKVAAIGISSSRWITTHGFALNVNPNLDYFDTSNILPCGIEGKGVTSMAKILQQQQQTPDPKTSIPSLLEVSQVVLTSIQQVFGISKLEPAIPPKIH